MKLKEMVYETEFRTKLLYRSSYKGYDYFVYSMGLFPTAYIGVDKSSKLYGKRTDELWKLPVHGGVTYASSSLNGYELLYDKSMWFIGWDYSHGFDYIGLYINNCSSINDNCKKWTTEEIIEECKFVIDNITEAEGDDEGMSNNETLIIEKHKELCDRIHETCVAKNHDYGNSVNKLYDEFGLISYIVRINDKVNRLNTLVKTKERQVQDEKITDTLLDLANYALLAVANMELKGSDEYE